MAISQIIKEKMTSRSAGVIRKMFEEGLKLKKLYGEDKVYDFSLGNPDLDPPEAVFKAIEEVSKDHSKNCHGYMPNAGYDFARKAMAEKTAAEQGVEVDETSIVMSVGAAAALNVMMKAIMNSGNNVIVPAPFFAEYNHYINNAGGELKAVNTKADFSLDVEAVKNALNEKTAAVLINSPNNPTGRVYSEDEIKELCKVLSEHGNKCGRFPFLICDEPYRAIIYDGKKVPGTFKYYENTVVVTSFAKNLSLPGERIGYIAVNPKCSEKQDLVAACIFCTRTLGFVNAPAFFQKVVSKTWNAACDYSLYEKRRNNLMRVLDEAGIEHVIPEGAFYLWCKVPENFKGDDLDFCDYMKKFNILAAPGSGFGGKGWFRLAYCVSESTITNSLDAFKNCVNSI